MTYVSVHKAEDLRRVDDADSPNLLHVYSTPNPQVGDKALCGWIKVTPLNIEDVDPSRWGRCVVCSYLYGQMGCQ